MSAKQKKNNKNHQKHLNKKLNTKNDSCHKMNTICVELDQSKILVSQLGQTEKK